MVRLSVRTLAQIGRLQTPPPEAIMQGDQAFKGRKLFRDVWMELASSRGRPALLCSECCVRLQACRMLPWAVNNFKLQEVTTVVDLRRLVNEVFKKNSHLKDPKVIAAVDGAGSIA